MSTGYESPSPPSRAEVLAYLGVALVCLLLLPGQMARDRRETELAAQYERAVAAVEAGGLHRAEPRFREEVAQVVAVREIVGVRHRAEDHLLGSGREVRLQFGDGTERLYRIPASPPWDALRQGDRITVRRWQDRVTLLRASGEEWQTPDAPRPGSSATLVLLMVLGKSLGIGAILLALRLPYERFAWEMRRRRNR